MAQESIIIQRGKIIIHISKQNTHVMWWNNLNSLHFHYVIVEMKLYI